MNINHFQVTSAHTLNLTFTPSVPICVFHGHHSDLVLDLMRELLGDYGAQNNPDRFDDGRFVLHADIEMDGKSYDICLIRNADWMGDHRLAVNFRPNSLAFSEDDTQEFVKKCNERDKDTSNVLTKAIRITPTNDDRPLFIYDIFDRLDEATDIRPLLDQLSALNRQVFVATYAGYPLEKMRHHHVQMIKMEDTHDSD